MAKEEVNDWLSINSPKNWENINSATPDPPGVGLPIIKIPITTCRAYNKKWLKDTLLKAIMMQLIMMNLADQLTQVAAKDLSQ